MNGPSDPTRFVHDKCAELGFALCGVCEAQPTKWPRELWQWLEDGKHGEMDYLANHTAQRIDPGKMMPGIRSIICVADRYHDGSEDNAAHHEKGKGRIARYARGDDYHVVMKKRLHQLCDALIEAFPEETFRAFVDTAPVLEREHSTRAGLGAIGKHTLLIETGVGSYLLLGEVITTLRLEPEDSKQTIDPCGTCTRCIDACPTDAITPYSIDATKCISYLTIEHRGLIDETLHEPMGDWIFGCDICQEVCPHNQPTHRTSEAPVHEAYSPRKTWKEGFDLVTILNWTEDDRREAFIKSSMKRAKLDMMKRNALIAAGNAMTKTEFSEVRKRVNAIALDDTESDLVRETAQSIVMRLEAEDR